jgi:environmental stress-induced protein Ves
MSACRLIPLDGATPQRWRNGGGTTRELLAWPTVHSWRIRVSVADVDSDGPFSTFAGVERWFAVLDGNGVELAVDSGRHRLTAAGAPLRFSGEAATTCRLLDGPTRDLNLMLRGMRGGMFAASAGQPWRSRAAQCGLFAAVPGRCLGEESIAVPAHCLLWFDRAPAELRFAPDDVDVVRAGWWLAATPMEHKAWA